MAREHTAREHTARAALRWVVAQRRAGGIAAAVVVVLAAVGAADAQQLATTVQLPTFGISIDADGVLSVKAFEDPTGRLRQQRAEAARRALPADLARPSPLRKVSLKRLEAAVAARLGQGMPPDDAMTHLAGLQRLQFVFLYPEEGEIVIAGPAEPWMQDLAGRGVGVDSGMPPLLLEDLVVALRAFPPGGRPAPMIGCTIDPTAEGLARYRKFLGTVPRTVRQNQRAQVAAQIARGSQESLGMAQIRTFGVEADTHFSHVLLEADYRMKRIGIGLERPPVKIASYLALLSPSTVRQGTLQRWWFTPNYDCLKKTDDGLAVELVGQGVQLQTQDKVILAGGGLAGAPKANRASVRFTEGFTRNYPQLAAKSPVFAQLRNLIDMTVAAAWLQREDYYGRAAWRAEVWRDEDRFGVHGKPAPRQVATAVNALWKGSRLFAPAGGGVTIEPLEALRADRLLQDEDGNLGKRYSEVSVLPAEGWWWD